MLGLVCWLIADTLRLLWAAIWPPLPPRAATDDRPFTGRLTTLDGHPDRTRSGWDD